VVNARWIKPLDLEMVSWAATEHRLVVTVEENTAMGGFGSGVCEALADLRLDVPVLRLAVPDCFVTHGATSRLLADIGLTPDGVAAAVLGRLDDLDESASSTGEAGERDTAPHRRRAR
jgi:1-deoxy-D-xylulose-5-phosphate synthase